MLLNVRDDRGMISYCRSDYLTHVISFDVRLRLERKEVDELNDLFKGTGSFVAWLATRKLEPRWPIPTEEMASRWDMIERCCCGFTPAVDAEWLLLQQFLRSGLLQFGLGTIRKCSGIGRARFVARCFSKY